jgi:hypothetical protein
LRQLKGKSAFAMMDFSFYTGVPNLEAQMSTKFEAQMSIPFTGKKAQMSIARLNHIVKKHTV